MSTPTHKTAIVFTNQLGDEQAKACPHCGETIAFVSRPLCIVSLDAQGVPGVLCLKCCSRGGASLQLRVLRSYFGRRYGIKKDTPVARVLNGMTEQQLEAAGYQIVDAPVEEEMPMTVVEFPIEEVKSV